MNSTMGYIPLDDRPCNYGWPHKLTENTDIKILMPPKEFMGKFYTPGKREKIYEWLLENITSMDALILSIDMIAYGGLIASRKYGEKLPSILEKLSIIKKLKELNPNIKIYAFSVLMRISINVYCDETREHWKNIFNYSTVHYRIYHLKEKHLEEKLEELKKKIPKKILDNYISTRERNLTVNKKILDFVSGGMIDFLVYAQEDAAEYGIHREEQTELKKIIRKRDLFEKVDIFTGTDELGSLLIARYVNDLKEQNPKLYVEYNYDEGKFVIAPYEDCCLDISVGEHIRVMGGIQGTEPDNCDIIFMCHNSRETPLDLFSRNPEEFDPKPAERLLKKLKKYMAGEKPVAIADIYYSNGGDPALVSRLIKKDYTDKISSYSAINTTSNSIGFALALASLSYSLNYSRSHQKKLIIERIIDDCYYQTLCRPKINRIITEQGLSPLYITENSEEFEEKIRELLLKEMKSLMKKADIKNLRATLPWDRTFEVKVDFELFV